MRSTPNSLKSLHSPPVAVSVPVRLVSLLLLTALTPIGLLVAGLIWLEDGGPVFTGSLLEGTSDASQIPAFRVATLHLEKWDIRKLPASMGNPERLILIPTLTVIGRFLTILHLDRLPAMILVAMGRISPTLLLRPRVIYSN
jgi:lipopolysaccharide/colanic/teichoic acid biosynthesis glycosyltransferase